MSVKRERPQKLGISMRSSVHFPHRYSSQSNPITVKTMAHFRPLHAWKMPVYLRARPSRRSSGLSFKIFDRCSVNGQDETLRENGGATSTTTIGVDIGGTPFLGAFNNVFDEHTKQSTIFQHTAKPIVDSCLLGYNGTVFAYGQTGSGKTYTLTGGQHYKDRGIIPRTIEYVFRSPNVKRVRVCYVEIYQEVCYDLLDHKHRVTPVDDWDKVDVMQNQEGSIHLRGLNVHEAKTERDALNLLFTGNIHRMTSETPMNQASSRSHCIFTLIIETRHGPRQDGHSEASVYHSKLHLVDLAGSERQMSQRRYRRGYSRKFRGVGEPPFPPSNLSPEANSRKVDDSKKHDYSLLDTEQKREGKAINLSLHYLEQVIMRLRERTIRNNSKSPSARFKNNHIPYRNSLLTLVLRDSLGGNCRTAFIVTINPEIEFLDETKASCKFAQRLSCIESADVVPNEQIDINAKLKKLEQENLRLQDELADKTGISLLQETSIVPVSSGRMVGSEEMGQLESAVDTFLAPRGEDSDDFACFDLPQAHAFIHLMRNRFRGVSALLVKSIAKEKAAAARNAEIQDRVRKAECSLIKLRDNYSYQYMRQQHQDDNTARDGHGASDEPLPLSGADGSNQHGETMCVMARKRKRILSPQPSDETELAYSLSSNNAPSLAPSPAVSRIGSDDHHVNNGNGTETDDHESVAEEQHRVLVQCAEAVNRETKSKNVHDISPAITNSKGESSQMTWSDSPCLQRGGVFLKHGRKGSAHPRFVWVSSNGYIKWRKLGANETSSTTKRLAVSSLKHVQAGRSTKVFARDSTSLVKRAHCEDASFSLFFTDRTLDLEVDCDGTHRREVVRQHRDRWVKIFRSIVPSS